MIVSAVRRTARAAFSRLAPYRPTPGSIVVSATKGLEQDTLFRVSEIIAQELGHDVHVAALSGPSFAAEVARELPTAVSVASLDGPTSCSACRPSFGRRTSDCTARTTSSASRSAAR